MLSVQKSQKFFITGQPPWLFPVFTRLSLDSLAFRMVSRTSRMLVTNQCLSPAQASFLSPRPMRLSFESPWQHHFLLPLCSSSCVSLNASTIHLAAQVRPLSTLLTPPAPSSPCSLHLRSVDRFQSLRILFPSRRINTPTVSPHCELSSGTHHFSTDAPGPGPLSWSSLPNPFFTARRTVLKGSVERTIPLHQTP